MSARARDCGRGVSSRPRAGSTLITSILGRHQQRAIGAGDALAEVENAQAIERGAWHAMLHGDVLFRLGGRGHPGPAS